MLGKISPEGLSVGEKAAYDYAERELNAEHGWGEFSFDATVEARGHTNTEDFTRNDDYIRPWNYAKPLFNIDFEARVTPYGYGFANLSLGNFIYKEHSMDEWPEDGTRYVSSPFFGESGFSTNILMIPPAQLDYIDFNFPKRAFIAIGGSGWNFVAGRDRLSWGPGESGNFVVGGHLEYHDNLRTSWYNKNFKYTFSVSRFPWIGQYYQTDGAGYTYRTGTGVFYPESSGFDDTEEHESQKRMLAESMTGINLFIAHRVEWRLWKDKLNFAVTESVMYEDAEGTVDPLVFSPVLFLHNLYTSINTNSLMAFEADWTVMPGLNIYGQVVVDEFAIPGVESAPGVAEDGANPDGLGYMLGAKTALPMGAGMFGASLEGAYTTPYLYLRSKMKLFVQYEKNHETTPEPDYGNYPLGFVVATKYTGTGGNSIYAEDFLGYRWGGDAIVVNANAGYRVFGQWNVKANLLLMFHGTHDKWTYWASVYPESTEGEVQNTQTPTTSHQTDNAADPGANDPSSERYRNAVAMTTALSLSGAWNLPWVPGLSVYGQGDFVFVVNKGNIEGKNAFDAQFTLGVSYRF